MTKTPDDGVTPVPDPLPSKLLEYYEEALRCSRGALNGKCQLTELIYREIPGPTSPVTPTELLCRAKVILWAIKEKCFHEQRADVAATIEETLRHQSPLLEVLVRNLWDQEQKK